MAASDLSVIDAMLREGDRDRWLASLFVPAEHRADIQTLYAFSLEVSRIRDQIREPMPGEIRLQWWADVLEGAARGDIGGHPVAARLTDLLRRHPFASKGLLQLIEARRFDLYDDPMPSLNDLEGYAGETASMLFQISATILAGGAGAGIADASGHAGCAYAMTGLMRALPLHARRGQMFLPADVLARHGASADKIRAGEASPHLAGALAEMREHVRHHLARAERALSDVPVAARAAFAGLALVPAYLKALEKTEPFGAPADVAGWRKPLTLWLWARRHR